MKPNNLVTKLLALECMEYIQRDSRLENHHLENYRSLRRDDDFFADCFEMPKKPLITSPANNYASIMLRRLEDKKENIKIIKDYALKDLH